MRTMCVWLPVQMRSRAGRPDSAAMETYRKWLYETWRVRYV